MHNLDSFQKLCEKALLRSCVVNDLQDFLIIQKKRKKEKKEKEEQILLEENES